MCKFCVKTVIEGRVFKKEKMVNARCGCNCKEIVQRARIYPEALGQPKAGYTIRTGYCKLCKHAIFEVEIVNLGSYNIDFLHGKNKG